MKTLFFLLLFFITGCHTSKLCRPDKHYSVTAYWRYGHIKKLVSYKNGQKPAGYVEHWKQLDRVKKSGELTGVLRYYDSCRTMIKEVHKSHYRRKSVHIYYSPKGVKEKKKIYRNDSRTKIITWDKWGKRTVEHLPKGGRMY